MLRSRAGLCELCGKRPVTHIAKFTIQFVESIGSPLFEEENLSSADLQRRVCEECVNELSSSKNVTNLVVDAL
jgi:hypothetical protein